MGLFDDIELEEDGVSSATLPEPPGKKGELFGDVDIGDIDLEVDVPDTVPSESPQKGNLFKDIDIGEPGDTKEFTVEKEKLVTAKSEPWGKALVEEHLEDMGEPFGDKMEQSFIAYEAALALGLRKLIWPDRPIPPDITEAITDPERSETATDHIQALVGTKGWIGDILDELQPESKGGPLEILPDHIFGIPTAEIPRHALNEFADLTGLILNPKQVLVLNPIFKFGLATLKYTGTKAVKWVKSILEKSKIKPGESGKAAADKVKQVVSEEAKIPVEELDKASREGIKELEVEVNKVGAESEARLLKNRIPEEGRGTGEPFDPVLEKRLALETELKGDIRAKVEGEQESSGIEVLEGGESPKTTKQDVYAETGGFAESEIAQNPPLVEMPELVSIAKDITKKYPRIVRKLIAAGGGRKAIGSARLPKGGGDAEIDLFAGMFQDPVVAAKVLAHEIGHVVDWLPSKIMTRGNILGRIASLKKYMKTILEEYPGGPGPLTAKDRAKIRRLAEKMAKEGQKTTPEVTPEDVLSIWRDVKSFEKNRPLNDWVANLTREQKVEVMKAALKGKFPEWADFAQVYKSAEPDVKALYRKLLKEEIEKRRLFEKDAILKELKTLTQKWKPFSEGLDPKFTKYRYSNEELYADAVSVLLNNPELLKSTAPNFYKAFFNYLERKPEFKESYLTILSRAKEGATETLLERQKNLHAMFARGEKARAETLEKEPGTVFDVLKKELIDNNAPRIKMVKDAKKKGAYIPPEKNPIYWAEEYPYTHAPYFEYLRNVENSVRIPLRDIGLSDVELGEYLMMRRIMTQRATIANPLGHTPATAARDMDLLKTQLGSEKFARLEQAAGDFSRARAEHMLPVLKKADMYSGELQKAIEDNIANYTKFEVRISLEKKFGKGEAGRLFKQEGTFQEIENPFTATLVQDAALMRAAAVKMERKMFVDTMQPAFSDFILPAKKKWNGKFHAPDGNAAPADMGMVTYLHKGEVEAWYLPKDIADNFNKNSLEAGKIVRALGYVTAPFKEIFVGKNPFWMTWNIQRDIKAMAKHLPGGNIPKALWYTTKAIPDTFKDVFLNMSTKEVSEMYKQKLLIVGRYYSALDIGPDKHMDKVMRLYGLSEKKYENNVIKPFVKLWEFLDKPGRFTERIVKIGAHKQLQETPVIQQKLFWKDYFPVAKEIAGVKPPPGYARQGMGIEIEKEIAHIVRTQAGSPDFLRKGHLSSLYNNLFLFSNAGKEGWRASMEAAKNNPLSYTWKTVKYDVMPKLIMYGGSIGWLGPKVKRMYANIPDRDKANYICIPLGFTKSGKTAYFVMPHDFMGQAIAGTLWKSLNTEKTEDIQALFDFTMGGLPYSSLNPVIGGSIDTMRYITGKNPYNSWSGRYVVPESVFRAGGQRSHKAFAKHMWNTMGGAVVYRFRHDNIDKIKGELESLYGIPLVGSGLSRFVRVSDYGVREQLKEVKNEEKQINANDLLDAKDVLYKLVNDGVDALTDADMKALGKKPGILLDSTLKMLVEQKNVPALEEYLSASTIKEQEAVIKKWHEIEKDYPAPSLLDQN